MAKFWREMIFSVKNVNFAQILHYICETDEIEGLSVL